ncbi:MAG: methyl-accepting chemotaxis protein [Acidobacteriota bacterium]
MAESIAKSSTSRPGTLERLRKALAPQRALRDREEPRRERSSQGGGVRLKAKILFFFLGWILALALVASLATAFVLQRQYEGLTADRGRVIAESWVAQLRQPLADGDTEAVRHLVAGAAGESGLAYLVIADRTGAQLAGAFAEGVDPAAVQAVTARPGAPVEIAVGGSGASRRALEMARRVAGDSATVRVGFDLSESAEEAQRAALQVLGWLALFGLLGAIAAFFFADRVTRPLRAMAGAALRASRGDYSEPVPVTSRDEFGVVSGAFNRLLGERQELRREQEAQGEVDRVERESLQANIREFLLVSTEIAKGDLTQRGRVTEDVLGNVVDAINLVVEQIGEILIGVRRTAESVNGGAGQMIEATDRMVTDIRNQAEDTQRMNREVALVSTNVRAVAQNAEGSEQAARQTREAAEAGQQAVGQTLDSMQRIRSEVQGIAGRIKVLGDRSLEISEIVETISDISSQTNLLALNAAIEASGAGAEGARFAVVADEVRKLADDSAKATKRIAELIETVQAEIQETVRAMENGTREVETGFQVTQKAGERLEEIGSIAGVSAQLAIRISSATQEQVAGVEQVAQGVRSVAEITSRTTDSVQEGRVIAEQLERLAEELSTSLARFKLPS